MNVRRPQANFDRARDAAGRGLAQTEGKSAVEQRLDKARLQNAAQAPAASAPGFGGGAGKGEGTMVLDLETGEEKLAKNLRNVGNKSFFQRADDQRWVDPSVTEEMEKNAIRLVQFSDEYFQVAEKHGRQLSQYLVFDEPLLINLGGQAYMIDPPTK